jgi:glycosyltransferase involved in cell wall biosynthesis
MTELMSAKSLQNKSLSGLRVVVVSDAAPQRNGVGAYYHDLMQYLKTELDELTIISPVIDEQGKWHGGFMLPLPGDHTQKLCFPSFFKIKKQMQAIQPDVVLIATPGLYGVAGAYYGNKLGAKVLVGFHTWFEKLTELYWGRIQAAVNRAYFNFSNSLLFRWSNCVYANSDEMVDICKQLNAPCTRLVGTPVSYEFIHQPQSSLPDQCRRVLFAGRLAAEKNLQSIIAAAENHPDIEFSVSGDGPELGLVQDADNRLANFKYLGWLEREKLLSEMDQHDVVVLPSHVESFGTIALEAMARSRLTIVSSHCGIAQWPELKDGMVVIPADKTLSETLDEAVEWNKDQLHRSCQEGRERAVQLNDQSLSLWRDFLIETKESSND